jgi:hypothetical protein
LKHRIGIAVRVVMTLFIAATVFVPVAAQAATCSMPSCTSGCCMMDEGAPAGAMSMSSCCAQPGVTMSQSSCPGPDQRPDFKAISSVPEVVSPAVPLGVASLIGPDLSAGYAPASAAANARGPGDLLAGVRLLI